MRKLSSAGSIAGILLVVGAASGRAPDQEAINRAIDKGVTIIRGMQGADGTWRYNDIGATSLAALTLLECGAKSDDKAVLQAADAVRKASLTLTHTYSLALTILFFDRLGDPADIPLIEALTVRLLAGQTATGGWNYQCPAVGDAEARHLQTRIGQHKELAGRRGPPKPGDPKRTIKDLPKEIQQQLAVLHRLDATPTVIGSDNSNTQFATLALWVARRYGLPVEHALKRVEARFRGSQHGDGGWGYFEEGTRRGPMAGSTASMTCAGLLALAVADGRATEAAHERRPGSKTTRDFAKDPNVRRGLLALSTTIGMPGGAGRRPGERPTMGAVGGRTYYFLWSLERVAVALDLKTIGKKDWYAWGAELLLANQQADGTWRGNFASCGADTCFALLFLKRANLAPDLTSQFTGQVQDPGERILKRGGFGGEGLSSEKIVDLKPGIEGKDAPPTIEGKYPEEKNDNPPPKAIAKPLREPADSPKAPVTVVERKAPTTVAERMAADLVESTGSRHSQLLKQMQDGKGTDFTVSLALAIPRLSGEGQRKARSSLAERLSRMKDSTLTAYLADEDVEIRRAAVSACALKANKELIPRVIPLLRDPNSSVVETAREALNDLSGCDFGPAADASREDKERAVRQWLDWWNKRARK